MRTLHQYILLKKQKKYINRLCFEVKEIYIELGRSIDKDDFTERLNGLLEKYKKYKYLVIY